MSEIVLIDTSIYLNVLDVPDRNQERATVLDIFKQRVKNGDHFLLPMVSILETGNHIAHLKDGTLSRKFAVTLVDDFDPLWPFQFRWQVIGS